MNHMKRWPLTVLALSCALAAAGCGGADGQDGRPLSSRSAPIEPGDTCTNGGIQIELGVDTNGDGELGDDEVTETTTVCHGEDGLNGEDGADGQDGTNGQDGQDGADGEDGATSLVDVSDEPAGTNCTAGGYKVETGLDNGDGGETADDGVLDAGEVDSTSYVCHGVNGYQIVTMLTADTTGSCASGGQRLDMGLDNGDNGGTARDGVLDAGEIDSTTVLCNGEDGATGDPGPDGSSGYTTLVEQNAASSTACPDGGVTITSGLDADGDGVLDAGEIDHTSHVCDGADASSGGGAQLVDNNGVVLGTVLSANLREVSIRTSNNYLVSINWDGSLLDKYATYGGTNCTGTLYLYIDGTSMSIHADAAFWSSNENAFLVPDNPGGDPAVSSQVLPYESYWDGGCNNSSSQGDDMWPADTVSRSAVGLPSSIVAPLTIQ